MPNGFSGKYLLILVISVAVLLLGSCSTVGDGAPTSTSTETISESATVRPETTATATLVPTPTAPPRILTICMADEPETLFIYGGRSLAQSHVLEAIYDGPVDLLGYEYQPVILEKLPRLDEDDAVLVPVSVAAGDWVVNEAGQLVKLNQGEIVRPFGCQSETCAIAWNGEELQMAQLSATFTIIEGLKWSDSTPLTAVDSVFSYQIARQCEEEFGSCGALGLANRPGGDTTARTASYEALDGRRVRWTGVPGFLDAAYQTNFYLPLPEHQLGGRDLQDLLSTRGANQEPLGWGAYIITDWIPGEYISLRQNPLYFRAEEIPARFDQLLFRFIGQDAERNLEALTSGGCDLLDQSAAQVYLSDGIAEIQQLEEAGDLLNYVVAGPEWEHADFGIQPLSYDDGYHPGVDRPDFFSDVRVRQAFALCMNRQKINSEVLSGLSVAPDSYLPAEHPLFSPTVRRYEFDLETGSQLLEEAGWLDDDGDPGTPRVARGIQGIIDGTPFSVVYATSTALQRQAAGEILADSLAECGIQLELLFAPAGEVFAPGPQGPVFGRQFDLTQFAWGTGPEPLCALWNSEQVPGDPNLKDENDEARFPFGWSGVNETGFRDQAYDQACDLALDTLPAQPGYLEAHQAAQDIFSQQLPVIPLYRHLKLAISRADMCGVLLDASNISEMWNIENFNYGEGCL
jgi:peptide/nickel transport system substrate-binding protein